MFAYRILVHCPILRHCNSNKGKRHKYCEARKSLFKAIKHLDTKEHESPLDIDVFFTYSELVNPKSSGWLKNLEYKMNKAREIVITQNYDFLLNIEDDIIIPKDTIPVLLNYYEKTKAPIISGLYRLWKNKYKLLCGKVLPKKWLKEEHIENKDFIELYLVCFGCTLIHRDVLVKVKFNGTDGDFAKQTHQLGFKKILVPSLKCGHIFEEGEVIWP